MFSTLGRPAAQSELGVTAGSCRYKYSGWNQTRATSEAARVVIAATATRVFFTPDGGPPLDCRCFRFKRFCSSRASILAQGSLSRKCVSTFAQSLHGSVRLQLAELDCCRIR